MLESYIKRFLKYSTFMACYFGVKVCPEALVEKGVFASFAALEDVDETTLWEIVSMCLKFLVSVTLDDYNRGEVSSLIFYFANVWLATMKVEIFVTILWHDDHCEGEVLGSFWLLRVGESILK